MLITILVLSVLNTALTFLALARTGRIISDHNDQASVLVDVSNFQNKKLRELGDTIESAMDALLIADYKAASTSGEDVN